jgi:SpoVK/Ycf46/Vps4 family AAA+-type ATPase
LSGPAVHQQREFRVSIAFGPTAGRQPTRQPDQPAHQHPQQTEIIRLIRSRHSLIQIVTSEEERVVDWLANYAKHLRQPHGMKVHLWSSTDGLIENRRSVKADESTIAPDAALRKVLSSDPDAGLLFVFRDFDAYFESPEITRLVRDCAHHLRNTENALILLGSRSGSPVSLENDLISIDFPLPSKPELRSLLDRTVLDLRANPNYNVELTDQDREAIVRALRGLTETAAENALAKAAVEFDGLCPAAVSSIMKTKRDVIKRAGALEWIEVDADMSSVGGLDLMKSWVRKRSRSFTEAAKQFGVEAPKGLVALGIPGGGKSLAARAVAAEWGIPLLRLDMGAVFGSLVGESERNIRNALKIAEAASPAVLWCDEVEKALSGAGGGGDTDGGTTRRVFGTLLTWLQERRAPCVVYFTANDVEALPPELLRKGRVDEIFFIDAPNVRERLEILAIHLKKRGRNPAEFDLEQLAAESEDFVGAEIEQAIKEALVEAFHEGRDMHDGDIIKSFRNSEPLVKSQVHKLAAIRKFVESKLAVRASSPDGPPF